MPESMEAAITLGDPSLGKTITGTVLDRVKYHVLEKIYVLIISVNIFYFKNVKIVPLKKKICFRTLQKSPKLIYSICKKISRD